MASSSEHGNELSGSIKCGEFLKEVRNYHLLKENPTPWSCELLYSVNIMLRAVLRS